MSGCSNIALYYFFKITKNILTLLQIIVPILMIISLIVIMIQLMSDPENKKYRSKIKNCILAGVITFFIPLLVNVSIGLVEEGFDIETCWNVEKEPGKKSKYLNVSQKNKKNPIITGEYEKGQEQEPASSTNNPEIDLTDTVGTYKGSFTFEKKAITIGHYKNKVNQYQLVLKNSNNKTIPKTKFGYKSANPAVASVSEDGLITGNFQGKTTVYVRGKDETVTITVNVTHSLYTYVKLKSNFTGTDINTKKKITLKKGTKGIYNGVGFANNSGHCNGYLLGDTFKYGDKYIKIPVQNVQAVDYYVSDIMDATTAEDFINNSKIDSSTQYLFWSNHGSGTEYMFTGRKENWSLVKTMPIQVGDASNIINKDGHSCTGVHFNYEIGYNENRSGYTHKVIWKGKPNGGRTNPWHEYGSGKRTPASHGCTRFMTKDIVWLNNNHARFKGSRLIDY